MPIRPGVPAPGLAARMGEDALRERGGVEYRELKSRSLLNRCDAPRMPFTWTVNPYRGCAMGCRYCYATYTHEFMGIAEADRFHSLVYVKTGAEAETAKRLAAVVKSGESIALGTATDPYQPGEADAKVTRGFLEQVAGHRNLRLGIVTKGALVLRDLDLLAKIHAPLPSHRARLAGLARTPISCAASIPGRRRPMSASRSCAGSWRPAIDARLGLAPILPAHHRRRGEPRPAPGARGRGRRAPDVQPGALPPLPHPREVPALAGRGAPAPVEAYERSYAGRAYLEGPYKDRVLAHGAAARRRTASSRERRRGRRLAAAEQIRAVLAMPSA